MRTSVSDSTVLTAHTAPPTEYALLNIALYAGAVDPPDVSGQEGRVRRVSRGMLTIVARSRPASRCTTIAVSERAPELLPPPSALFCLPLRESEPRTRMFREPVESGAAAEASADGLGAGFGGRSSARALAMSTLLMLLSRCQYAQPAAPAVSTSRPAMVRPAIFSTLDRRPLGLPVSPL